MQRPTGSAAILAVAAGSVVVVAALGACASDSQRASESQGGTPSAIPTAQAGFRPVITDGQGAPSSATPTAGNHPPIQSDRRSAALDAQFANLDCSDPSSRPAAAATEPDQLLVTCSADGFTKYLLDTTVLDGIRAVSADAQQQGEQWQVTATFDAAGKRALTELTTKLAGEPAPSNALAVVLDGVVLSAPAIVQPISGGQVAITGYMSEREARTLAAALTTASR